MKVIARLICKLWGHKWKSDFLNLRCLRCGEVKDLTTICGEIAETVARAMKAYANYINGLVGEQQEAERAAEVSEQAAIERAREGLGKGRSG